MQQPNAFSRIGHPAGGCDDNKRGHACQQNTLQQHKLRETTPTQDRVTAEQPAQAGIKQQTKDGPTPGPYQRLGRKGTESQYVAAAIRASRII